MSLQFRDKMITFRVTQEEYGTFQKLCATRGLRSISETAREALNMLLHGSLSAEATLVHRVAELEAQQRGLIAEIKKLKRAASHILAAAPSVDGSTKDN